jgi:hypothetical protein
MTSVIFDPDARTEFLASVKYYEDCQHGLGTIVSDLLSNQQQRKFKNHHFVTVYSTHHLGGIFYKSFHFL